jgi:insulysin
LNVLISLTLFQPLKRPHLIRETSLSRLWHKKDDRFWVPKATVIVEMRSPVANASPLASVLTSLYSDLVRDALNEFTYAAELAGLNYNFSPATHGLYTTMSGYNDKLATLTHHVLEKVKNLSIDPKRLEVMKEQSKRDWENFSLSQSYQLSDYYARYILTHKQWTVQEKLQELPSE